MALVHDDGRHRVDALGVHLGLGGFDLGGVAVAVQQLLRVGLGQADRGGDRKQHGGVGHIAAFGEIGLQQCELQGALCRAAEALGGPVQQPVGGAGVVDAAARLHPELEIERGAAFLDGLPCACQGGRAGAVFLCQVFLDVLALGAHARVEFEGMEMQVQLQPGDAGGGGLQRIQADGAPGADHVGDEIDAHEGSGSGAARDCRFTGPMSVQCRGSCWPR
mmetsp:Transcript_3124/g.5430  ORF Transcript_3124/g.5430 Transcript_3124/m.5430 type:complete len:220 (+) Transcript_3124:410-1069(+)